MTLGLFGIAVSQNEILKSSDFKTQFLKSHLAFVNID
jgi:hypothetical protein